MKPISPFGLGPMIFASFVFKKRARCRQKFAVCFKKCCLKLQTKLALPPPNNEILPITSHNEIQIKLSSVITGWTKGKGCVLGGHGQSPVNGRPSSRACGAAYSLGHIDPRLYKREGAATMEDEEDEEEYPEGHIGRISFAVQYMRDAEKLIVTLFDARNLPRRRGGTGGSVGAHGGLACDPFIK